MGTRVLDEAVLDVRRKGMKGKIDRLFSLDVLRGLDMLLLVVIGPLILKANAAWHCFSAGFIGQFRHGWECFTLWDIIMPLFIFMCGAAVPFALKRRMDGGLASYWRHVLVRVTLLWFLGMLVQGGLADLNPLTFDPFSNTLQAIAVGYLVTAAVMCVPSRTFGIGVTVLLALLYSLCLALGGDYTEFGNFAFKVDHWVHVLIFPSGHTRLLYPYFYTWYLTSLMFAVMTLCGYHATCLLQAAWPKRDKAMALFAYSAALLIVGFFASLWIPVIKPIFTLSFTSLAMGWSVLALAILYVINDVFMIRRGFGVVLLFGQCALAAYFVSAFFRPVLESFSQTIACGVLPHFSEGVRPFVLQVVVSASLVVFLVAWRRQRRK